MEGRLLAGRYQIHHILGTGGMATVYKAYDNVQDRTVAIKIMNQRLIYDHEYVRRFVWEAQATGRLSHPNIVNLYDAGQEGPLYYMVMEYVEGQALRQLIQSKKRLSAKEAMQIAIQICSGLQHAHNHGIIHRDIKPHNIMCTPGGRYKVADFGIARLLRNTNNLTKTGTIMGSIHYFSPEQARGHVIGYPSDLYSLGIVMYEMVTGKVPFHAEEDIAIVLKHIQTPVPDPRKINPDIPAEFTQVLRKSMEKDPKKRFQTAEEMKKALQSALHATSKEKNPASRRSESLTKTRSNSKAYSISNTDRSRSSAQVQAQQRPNVDLRRKRTVEATKKKWIYLIGAIFIIILFGILLNSCLNSNNQESNHSIEQTKRTLVR
ncbi:serine/threonine-protein kinase [Croceifilum oryzae]|uniref:Serine/threonine-protein kinase PrkC n=1 Tax=Croceifilum oryzae TaxID=1553429 RepID=A0AAJ1TGQ6_9BACL|nr:protein kinase [Croceifilum oryzae]MDQ0416707.1 serine/threonine-protein kinase [Croceifilum oryzae]